MKKVGIVVAIIILLLVFLVGGFYIWGMGAVSSEGESKIFVIEPGTSKQTIVANMEKAGLIRNAYPVLAYLFFHGGTIQAGEYELNTNMTPAEMLDKFMNGDVKINSITITFIEGNRLTDFADEISENLSITSEEFLNVANDYEYLQELIHSGTYWFLTEEILNEEIYYPLEGYLYPDTYEFLETASAKDIIETMLNRTLEMLTPYQSEIASSGYSVHQILSLASIVEKEANTLEDRQMVAQVFYLRLRDNWSLGSDVTAYYGVGKDLTEGITMSELNDHNPYNTRLTDGTMNGKLPIGPICNSDISSIEATLHPSDTSYYYFVANVCTGEVFFQTTSAEFESKVYELQSVCEAN